MHRVTLLFEGIDRCGKSSLISAFRNKHNAYKLHKMRVPKTLGQAAMWYEELFWEIANNRDSLIYDRSHLSEAVYAPLYRDYTHHNWPSTLWHMERNCIQVKEYPIIVVYVYPQWLSLLKKDDRPNADVLKELDMYNLALNETRLPVIRITKHESHTWDWRKEEDVLAELEQEIDKIIYPQYAEVVA